MQECSNCGYKYDKSQYSKCPNCKVKPINKETFKKLCKFLFEN